jgi:NAD+ kinase
MGKATKKLERVLVVSKADSSGVEDHLARAGFEVVDVDPDFVVCFGGDGTVLFGERSFPGVPKLVVKTSRVCRRYGYALHELFGVLGRIREGDFEVVEEMKLVGEAGYVRLVGLNEVQVHLKLPYSAVRFSVSAGGNEVGDLIGDGVVVATPFGSTGYYAATGGAPFNEGIGISFNNLHNRKDNVRNFVVPENSVIKLSISRGPAWFLADNDKRFVELNAGDVATVRKADGVARFICVSGR